MPVLEDPASGIATSPSASVPPPDWHLLHQLPAGQQADLQQQTLRGGRTAADDLQRTRTDKDKAVQMAQTFSHVVLRGRLEVYAVLLYYT